MTEFCRQELSYLKGLEDDRVKRVRQEKQMATLRDVHHASDSEKLDSKI